LSVALGLSGGYHDAAAALVVDGELVGALQEERISRIKHDPGLPIGAARALLADQGLSSQDVESVFFHEDPYAHLERVLLWSLRSFPKGLKAFPQAMRKQLGSDLWVLDRIAQGLGIPRARIHKGEHHRSHAASAYLCSPFEHAAVLTVDGVGEHHSTGLWEGKGGEISCLGQLELPHSLGLLWAGVTAWMGLAVNRGEHEVMGLAAHGQPCFAAVFERWLTQSSNGSFQVDAEPLAWLNDPERGFGPAMEAALGPARAFNARWALSDHDFQLRADVAASLQQRTNEVLLGLAQAIYERTGAKNLCVAGGVALNCRAIAHIQSKGPFEQVFVQPAAGDAGGALGAVLSGLGVRAEMTHAAWGVACDLDRVQGLAGQLGMRVQRLGHPVERAAEHLASGQALAWVQGRCEWGPRGLGNRAILGCAADRALGARLSTQVKPRAPFRPFAPVISATRFSQHFEGEPDLCTPFMTTLRQTRNQQSPATTHVDGSARVQSVGENDVLHELLGAFEKESGHGVLLNTSLNGPGDPAVARETDALAWLMAHPTTPMLIDDLWIAT
jgi:carbamoyltransferase